MQKIISVFVVLFLASAKVAAQAAIILLLFGNKLAREDLHLSVDGGLNFTQVSQVDGKIKIGPNFGLGLHIALNDNLWLIPELKALSGKGIRAVTNDIFSLPPEFDNIKIDQESSLFMNYLDLPILIQYRFPGKAYISSGIQGSFLLKSRYESQLVLPEAVEVEVRQNVKDQMKGFDVGLPIEVGYELTRPENGKGMDLRIRYTLGFSNVFKDNLPFQGKNSVFQVFATFPIIYPDEK